MAARSFAAEGSIMGKLKQWNELYEEGGSKKSSSFFSLSSKEINMIQLASLNWVGPIGC